MADVDMYAADDDAAAKELDKMKKRLKEMEEEAVQDPATAAVYVGNPENGRRQRKHQISLQIQSLKSSLILPPGEDDVDKVLLETPEDDIDYQRVPLRDLILLAEHKERQTKKDEAAAAATTQSNVNRSDPYHEDDNVTSEQGGEYNDGETPIVEDSTAYFNYQTYMDKTPIARWSKQDTQVFYEAIRQFGTDLSMIQQLFPGRTRRQVKLKSKKEERQHPLRLRDALTTRTKDHSHFETVIERLKKMAAEERQNAENDDSIDLTGNEVDEEGTSHAADGEAAKVEHVEEVEEEEDVVANEDTTDALKSDDAEEDDDDDLFLWSQYKSDAYL